MPSISGLVTNAALTAIENIIPDVSGLVKKLVNLKRDLLIIIMTNILLHQNLISLQQKFLMKDQHEEI